MSEDFKLCDGCENILLCSDTEVCTKELAASSGSVVRGPLQPLQGHGVCAACKKTDTLIDANLCPSCLGVGGWGDVLSEDFEECGTCDGLGTVEPERGIRGEICSACAAIQPRNDKADRL